MKYLTGRELNLGPLDCDPITLTTRPLGRDGRVAPASSGHSKGARQAQAALGRTLRELPDGPNPGLGGRGYPSAGQAGLGRNPAYEGFPPRCFGDGFFISAPRPSVSHTTEAFYLLGSAWHIN